MVSVTVEAGNGTSDAVAAPAGPCARADEVMFPRLCDGLLVLPTDGGLLFEGGPRRKLLRGGAASALASLLPLLDGQHAVPAIATELGWKVGDVQAAVSVLSASGLMEHGPATSAGQGPIVPRHVAAFLSRQINVTRRHRNVGSAITALTGASVLIIAPDHVAGPIHDALAAMAVGRLAAHAEPRTVRDSDLRAVASAGFPALAVMLDTPDAADAFCTAERKCRAYGIPLLRFAASPEKIEVGPIFHADFTACSACFGRGYREVNWAEVLPADGDQLGSDFNSNLAAGLVTQEILAIVCQVTWPASYRSLTVTPTTTLAPKRFAVTPYPECRTCGSSLLAADDAAAGPAASFEWIIQDPPAELWPAGDTMDSRGPAVPGLETQRPAFPTCPRRPLPRPETSIPAGRPRGAAAHRSPIQPDGHLSEAVIAGILSYAVGCEQRDGDPVPNRRWAPSAGNLGSTEIYALCRPGQFGSLPGTIFRYDDLSHEIVALRSDGPGLEECLSGTSLADDMPSMALVLVSAVGRISQKYGPSGFRLAHLDAGCAALQMAAVAESYGVEMSFAEHHGEALADLLELYQGQEEITVVGGIYPGRRDAAD